MGQDMAEDQSVVRSGKLTEVGGYSTMLDPGQHCIPLHPNPLVVSETQPLYLHVRGEHGVAHAGAPLHPAQHLCCVSQLGHPLGGHEAGALQGKMSAHAGSQPVRCGRGGVDFGDGDDQDGTCQGVLCDSCIPVRQQAPFYAPPVSSAPLPPAGLLLLAALLAPP